MRSTFALALSLSSALLAGHAVAETAVSGADSVPKTPDQRTWLPTNDQYFPERVVCKWVIIDGATLKPLTGQRCPALDEPPTPVLLGAIPVFVKTINKGDEAKGGIPGFASVDLQEKEVQSLTIVDMASVDTGQGSSELFCRDWLPILKNARDWKQGEELHYVDTAMLSHVTWKIGKEHTKDAQFGIGDYFSATGSQYDQMSTSGTMPAIAIHTSFKQITAADISGASCSGPSKPKLAKQLTDAPILLKAVVDAPALK